MLSVRFVFISTLISIGFTTFYEPEIVDIVSKQEYHFSIAYCDFSVPPYITTMNAHCYCFFNTTTGTSYSCSIPGPTFIFHPGDKVLITWHNQLSGSTSDASYHNQMKDLDVTNIHTHGLHISPDEDDTFLELSPGASWTYSYTIPDDHYPGTHWIHAHHHGSSSFQITSGLFSALLVEYDEKDTKKSDLDELLSTMEENILLFHWYYIIKTSKCDCDDTEQWQSYFYYPPAFDVDDCLSGKDCYPIFSYCYQYCSMPETQRMVSGFTYKMETEYLNNFQLFLVNGQYEPVIDDLTVNTFRRFRFINAMSQYYIQYKFPITSCDWYIIAIDGIFLSEDEVRSINNGPYYGEYLLPSGGRLDVIVECSKSGIYNVITTENNDNDPDLINIVRAPDGYTLFRMAVSGTDDAYDNTAPKIDYPSRPQYLSDLRKLNTNNCGCNTYFTENTTSVVTWTEKECGVVFNMKDNHNINGVVFDPNTPSTSLEIDNVYEFIFIPHKHIYHQHINPFQIIDDIGYNGFQAQAGDWFDTLGGPKLKEYKFRTYPIDFPGSQVVHCHVLTHADMGMMTYYDILNPTKICDDSSGEVIPAPTYYPTYSPSPEPTKAPIPTKSPTPEPTMAPTPFCPLVAESKTDFILLFDDSCGLSSDDCDELLKGVGDIITGLLSNTNKTRIQTMEYLEEGNPRVLVEFGNTALQRNATIYAEFIKRDGNCELGGNNKTDLVTALDDVARFFDLEDGRLDKLILINGCKDNREEICDIIAPDFDVLGITSYIVNFIDASSATNVITSVDGDMYLKCMTDYDSNRFCVGDDIPGISADEFAAINEECLFPAICHPTDFPTGFPTEDPVQDECFLGSRCVETEDCCSGDIDERALGITCSCYTKFNVDRWDSDNNFCCILKGNSGCLTDEDCCKYKTVCKDGVCSNK